MGQPTVEKANAYHTLRSREELGELTGLLKNVKVLLQFGKCVPKKRVVHFLPVSFVDARPASRIERVMPVFV